MPLRHLVEELDDVGEVHVPVDDDVSVGLHQTQGNEQIELWTSNLPCSPDRLPNSRMDHHQSIIDNPIVKILSADVYLYTFG